MTFTLPSSLEEPLRRYARERGRGVEEIIAEVLSREIGVSPPTNGNGLGEPSRRSLKGTVLKYDDPCEPTLPESDWEALR